MVSLIMVEAPASTKRSLSSPTAGLEAMPEVASEPPHSMPMSSSEMSQGTRCCLEAAAAISRAARTAFSMVFKVPPSSWIPKEATGLSVRAWIFSLSSLWGTVSQPRPMITTP